MEDDHKKNERQSQKKWKMTLKKNKKWKTTSKKNERRPQKKWKTPKKKLKMEDNLKHNLKKSTLIGCDIIVN